MPSSDHNEVNRAREALAHAHSWLENVDRYATGYFGLDHAIGENDDGCQLCGAYAALDRLRGQDRLREATSKAIDDLCWLAEQEQEKDDDGLSERLYEVARPLEQALAALPTDREERT